MNFLTVSCSIKLHGKNWLRQVEITSGIIVGVIAAADRSVL
jgi:hypothetical protein